jgi:DNA-binding MarR family transcriptional regulator
MKAEETIDHPIRWAWHQIAKQYNSEASKYGGTMSIGYVLLNIDPEGTPSTSLGPKMGMEPTSLSRILKHLEQEGLITRSKDEQDGRISRIQLTKDGKKMRDVSRSTVIRFNTAMAEQLSAKDLKDFQRVMNKINKTLSQGEIFK